MKNTTNPIQKKLKKNSAFTLIELLIAVGIIALIVAIAVPALFNSKAQADRESAEARAKVLNEARDRAILGNVGGITSMEQWQTNFPGTNNSTNAIMFLLTNNLIRAGAAQ
jgi:prepilin-type N-terminal cleavage/methylation domain-containing protein